MDHIDDPLEPSSNTIDGKLEACWFFGNLLDKRPTKTMLRCYSDPSPSSNYKSSSKKVSEGGGCDRPNLIRTPSLPQPCTARGEEIMNKPRPKPLRQNSHRAPSLPSCVGREEDAEIMSKPRPKLSRQILRRAPSLPPCVGREEDAESDFAMSKLIRQASLNSQDLLPPRRSSKGMKKSYSAPKNRLSKNPEPESIIFMNSCIEKRSEHLNQTKMRKSMSDLEFEEVQGFKDLGFKFDNMDLNPSVVNIIPGLQEKSRVGSNEDEARKPYLSEAWRVQRPSPVIPSWVDKNKSSSAEDMKAQIKFWARSVAANVR
ncbi:hypothetical protein Acr_23g0008080 [Actinidia rufa]|uniref:Uncharacterized protein n=1 Tax=Actinidia rufa TaxID=165716 RepID=A0A7J0GNS3_9ERIC|nr:hypothetical protein Acr_23g0008080 [Actinidia rufa]